MNWKMFEEKTEKEISKYVQFKAAKITGGYKNRYVNKKNWDLNVLSE